MNNWSVRVSFHCRRVPRDENLLEGQEDIGFWMNGVKTEEILYQIDLFIQDSLVTRAIQMHP